MQPNERQAWIDYGLPRERPVLLKEYLAHFGIDSIPTPDYDRRTGAITVWQLNKIGDGEGGFHREYTPSQYPGTVDGLVAALEKRWLLAPPSYYGVETVENGNGIPGERGSGGGSKTKKPAKRSLFKRKTSRKKK